MQSIYKCKTIAPIPQYSFRLDYVLPNIPHMTFLHIYANIRYDMIRFSFPTLFPALHLPSATLFGSIRIPRARLALVGTGPDAEALKDYFAGTKTVLTGIMTGDALSQAFASADVFVMPSDSETLGFVVLESMASGVPVVGAKAGGIPDLIADGQVSFFISFLFGVVFCRGGPN